MADWQPIETAPKDGTLILLLLSTPLHSNDIYLYVPWKDTRVVMGWWIYLASEAEKLGSWETCFIDEGASDSDGTQHFYHVSATHMPDERWPTHWMPLPIPI